MEAQDVSSDAFSGVGSSHVQRLTIGDMGSVTLVFAPAGVRAPGILVVVLAEFRRGVATRARR
jgi:hypothetical protein